MFVIKKNKLMKNIDSYFSFILGRKYFLEVIKKHRNIMLFIDYIKFDSQTFDCYIFCFEFVFQFHPLEFDLCINFGPYFF
jgi:hypothetical protein